MLHRFAGGTDGATPVAGLTEVNGTLYGTTANGGNNRCIAGCGTVFKITATGEEMVLYSFADYPSDGSYPEAGLTKVKGALYGTTNRGGTGDIGTVFSITTAGIETPLYSFGGNHDGAYPEAGVTEVNGTLYGTTYKGGTHSHGTVYSLSGF